MTTRYVGVGGNDGNSGLSWALRKLTLTGVEDTPVEAGDTVYVGPGTYREKLVCDVDGESGAIISYIGDYDGSHTDGVGGLVRITASDNDLASARNICVDMNGKDYRTFQGFQFDAGASIYSAIWMNANVDHLTISGCYFVSNSAGILAYGTTLTTNMLVHNCVFINTTGPIKDNTVQDNSGNIIDNCLFFASGVAISTKSGGLIVRNCTFMSAYQCVTVAASLNSGQVVTVNNCIMLATNHYALVASTLGNLVEDYNICQSRSNVAVGDHSNFNLVHFDSRWFFEMIGGGSMLTPFDLASYSQLIDVAGTSPTTADMRGTTVQGTQREWGALEYDSTLDIEAGTGTAGGAVKIMPLGRVGL